ncbi:hypothetical protein [Litoreibacter janthinus]|uniref:Type IV pilus biogenesis protein PilP n=1 Tax=Litoreibacter janthinus TaxID=670154 RepID=A0A1I6GM22_9RHOB|nr:hypothetical protein [Litoreibacter janthinus]SFR43181.1 hypothetical protein SAMN04488002_1686 [Litoreibacter janthinus]
MTPNFALNLSEDGIVLLHRHVSGEGWVEVGQAPLDSADLGAALSELRDKAEAIEGPDFKTKLVLPPSQLLYATIAVDKDLKADVEHALETRTPYTVDQLNYDVSGEAPEVKVVAVARETLEEAESFLGPYGFNPVGFTALPDPEYFEGEPNLGPLPSVGGNGLTPDQTPIRVLTQEEAEALVVAPPEPEIEEPQTTPTDAEVPELESKPEPEPQEDIPSPEPSDNYPEPDPEPIADIKPPAEPELPVTPPAAFSSRRKPSLGPADSAGDLVTSRAPRIAIPTEETRAPAAPKKSVRVEPRIKTGDAAKKKPAPPIVPPPTVAKAIADKIEKAEPKSSRLGRGVAALRTKAKKVTDRPSKAKPANVSPDRPDPIAELAAKQAAGKPRFLGLILTAILLVVLLVFAALSSYLLPENAVSKLFGGGDPDAEQVETAVTAPVEPELEDGERLAALPPVVDVPAFSVPSEEELAEAETPEPEILLLPRMSETEAETAYAVSGIWQMAPDLRAEMTRQDLDDLYESSLDPAIAFEDAPALASFDAAAQALDFAEPAAPPPAAILFSLDERGLVRPTPEGAENPDGIMVFLGKPPVLPERRPQGLTSDAAVPQADPDVAIAEPDAPAADARLAGFKPNQRPSDLQERFERANQAGRTRAELAKIRPVIRPESAQAQAREEAIAKALAEADADAQEAAARQAAEAAAQAELDKPTAQAVARSLRPGSRPRNFERVVARARQVPEADRNPAAAASTAAVARGTGPAVARNSRAAPTGTTRASVARAATDNNAIALGKVALVGVFGTSSNRRALVRMPNGRFKKVGVGDRIDGGRIAAIGEGQLKYTKGGRTVTLQMPKG